MDRRSCATLLLCCLVVWAVAGCRSGPPAITGITIFPADTHGVPQGDDMCRTRSRPPIPLIGVRPGADPSRSTSFLNNPATGQIAIALARGVQHFLLYTAWTNSSDDMVIAIFLDHEATPALSSLTHSNQPAAVTASPAPIAMGMDGDAVVNQSALSVVRGVYRVSLLQSEPPHPRARLDTLNPWELRPDNVGDSVGVITIEVEALSAG